MCSIENGVKIFCNIHRETPVLESVFIKDAHPPIKMSVLTDRYFLPVIFSSNFSLINLPSKHFTYSKSTIEILEKVVKDVQS